MNLIKFFIEQVSYQEFFLYFVLSAGPTLLWLLVCLWLDRDAPEPKIAILKIFLWGVMITFPLIYISGYLTRTVNKITHINTIINIFMLSFLIDGFIEESAKYFILRFRSYKSKYFDELRDGFVYGMILGLGFAFSENFLYGIVDTSISSGMSTVLVRGVTTTFLHFLTGGIIGYYIALVKMKSISNLAGLKGLGLAILLHGFYNAIIRFEVWWSIFPLAFILIFVYILCFLKIKSLTNKS
ncbi:PrsW family intramembrane metalloprotease [Patescibacteria group bacterium]|nr:PrsW family intramembrane metalloprotease [Patescibacteria group bacterium]